MFFKWRNEEMSKIGPSFTKSSLKKNVHLGYKILGSNDFKINY